MYNPVSPDCCISTGQNTLALPQISSTRLASADGEQYRYPASKLQHRQVVFSLPAHDTLSFFLTTLLGTFQD